MSLNQTDVFVIGGGPAGMAAAIAALQRGFRVVVADGGEPPIDKPCGEGLMPDGLAALQSLGLHLPLNETHPFCGIRFISSDLSAQAAFPDGSHGLAMRRLKLHRFLTERASQLGAEFLWRTPVEGIAEDRVYVRNASIRTRWIIGADGANSRVRRWAGLDRVRPRLRYAFRRHYRVKPWTDHMEIYWGRRCQGYATPVSPDEVCVAVASNDSNLRLDQALQELSGLHEHLKGSEATSAERGAMTGNRVFRRIWRGNVALIGDASGTVDAITGEGIGLAFQQAAALVNCLETGNLRAYQVRHRQLMLRPRLMARLMLLQDRRPRLQRRTLKVFRDHPHVFEKLLALHLGAVAPTELLRDGLTLGWGLLTA